MAKVRLTRDVEVRHEVDILIAGGGPSGVAAAITAARQGLRVLVLEAQSCLGGMGTAGGLPIFCGFTDGKNFVDGGVCREMHDRLRSMGGFAPPRWEKFMGVGDVVYRVEVLKQLYDDLLLENGVAFVLCTQCIGVETKDGRIETVFCWGKSGFFAVKASVVLDCTGDGDLCVWAGAPFEKGDARGRMQAGTLLSLWADIDWDAA